MKARLVLEAARRKLVELDWIQGSYQKALGKQIHFEGPTAQFWDEKTAKYVTIPIAKTDAVCAMGAVELALSNKVDLGEEEVSMWEDLGIYQEVRELLRDSIDPYALPAFDDLPQDVKERYREFYDEYVADELVRYPNERPLDFIDFVSDVIQDDYGLDGDSVEDWNDQDGRTKEEVVAAFDRAIALARERETLVPVAV